MLENPSQQSVGNVPLDSVVAALMNGAGLRGIGAVSGPTERRPEDARRTDHVYRAPVRTTGCAGISAVGPQAPQGERP